ncbi:MAG: IPT/TIG domain-containing protein [Candidatus Acidiferrales bacterium]
MSKLKSLSGWTKAAAILGLCLLGGMYILVVKSKHAAAPARQAAGSFAPSSSAAFSPQNSAAITHSAPSGRKRNHQANPAKLSKLPKGLKQSAQGLADLAASRNLTSPDQKPIIPAVGGAVDKNGFQMQADGTVSEGETGEDPKQRANYFYHQRAYPFDQTPAGARQHSLQQLDEMIRQQRAMGILPEEGAAVPNSIIGFPGPANWTTLGPQPVTNSAGFSNFGNPVATGRVTAIAVDPTTTSLPNVTVYVGGATGGVWKSTDGGNTWNSIFDQNNSMAIGGIAIAPSSNTTIYVGTGELSFSGDSYYGAGVYMSTDGGSTWTQECGGVSVNFCVPVGGFGFQGGGFVVGPIAVNPTNANIALAAVQDWGNESLSGIYRTTDGGANWALISSASGAAGNRVIWNPTDNTIVYATLGEEGNSADYGVYKSSDSGVTFTRLTGNGVAGNNLPTSNIGRHEIAVAPSNGSVVYVAISNLTTSGLLGLGKSTDAGVTWTFAAPGVFTVPGPQAVLPNFCTPQCWYDMSLAVLPNNPSTIVVGGSAFTNNSSTDFISSDGGTTWTDITNGSTAVRPHVDTHAFFFASTGGSNYRLYTGNDGGIWYTDNPTATPVTWVTANNANLTLTQFYPGLSTHPSDENISYGGTQDNGTEKYSGILAWDHVTCGDGGWTAVDPQIPTTVYASCQNIELLRSALDGTAPSWLLINNEIPTNGSERSLFIPPLVHDPNTSGLLYFGTFRVWQTMNYGNDWTPISPSLTGDWVTSVTPSFSSPNVVYATTSDGLVWGTTNALSGSGATWTNLTSSPLPPRYATMVRTDQNSPSIAYLSYSGFSGFADNVGHIFKTINGGTTWVDISGSGAGALPNTPVNDIAVVHIGSLGFDAVFIATDVGVFECANPTAPSPCATWTPVGTGLPKAPVVALGYRENSATLRAVTHGRGVWVMETPGISAAGLLLLTSITPSSQPMGAAAFTMTFLGNDFGLPSGTPEVLVDGVNTGTSVVVTNPNLMTATIPASVMTNPGVHQIAIDQPGHASTPQNPTSGLTFSVTGPAPTLSLIAPTQVPAGSASFPLTATGTSFSCASAPSGSLVQFGLTLLTATSCSSTSLTVTVPSNLVTTAGAVSVKVVSPGPGGGTTGSAGFTITVVSNPVPTISNLVPPSAVTGSGAFTLTVNGTGFVSGAVVSFGGANRATTFVNATQVTAAILAGDIAAVGTPAVVVTNPAPGGGASNSVNFTVSNNNPVPVITPPLVPSSVIVGSGAFTLTVNGTGFVNGSVVSFGGVNRVTTFVNSTQVTAAILAGDVATAGTPAVVVTNPAPGGGASNAVNFAVNNPFPTITPPLVPSSATVGSGAFTLTVNGTGFVNGAVVGFDFANRVTTFVSATQVTAAILAGDVVTAGTHFVNVTNPAPGGGASASVNFTVTNPVPVITPPLVPSSATAGSGAFTLTVNGTSFVNGAVVSFGGANRATTFVSATQVTAAILAGDIATAGMPAVVVTNPVPGGGASNSVNFTVNNPVPVITPPLVPSSATVGSGAFTLTVNGTGFVNGSVVSFGGTNRVTTFVNSTQVTAAILAGDIATAGTPAVVVTNAAPGGGASNAVNFAVNNPVPVITPPLVPSGAVTGSGAFTLTVNGTGFVNGATVSFGGANRVTTFVSATQVTAAILAGDIAAVGTPAVVVTNPAPGGGASNAVNFNVSAPNPVPVITPPLVPSSATAGSGAFTLTVNGTSFVNGAVVSFGGANRATTFVSATQVTASILAGDVATGGTPAVVVTNPAPGGGASNAVNFTVNNPVPVITPPLVPSSAIVGGAGFTLTVNGTGFVNGSVVSFGGANRVTTFVNSTQVTAAILAGDIATAGAPAVVVTNPAPGGGASNAVNFTVNNPAPVITPPLAPSSAIVGGAGFTLTVNGTGFVNGSVVSFGGANRVTTFVSSTQVTAAILAADIATVGTPAVVVTNPAPGGGASNAVNFAVNNPPPVITPPLVPSSATAGSGAFTLTVNGTGFINGATVSFGGANRVTTFVNSTQVTAAILAGDIATAGTPAVVVTNPAPGGGASNAVNFTVNNPAPVITPPLVPSSATAGSGAFTLTVNGTGFVNGSVVSFGGANRVTTFVNSTQVTAAILAADIATGATPAVVVTNPAPGGGASNAVNFTVNNPVPVITPPLVPSSAIVGSAGFTLTVNGTGFVNGAVVKFGGANRVTTFVSATQVTAAILAADIAAVGTPAVVVTNPAPGGGASNAVNFAVNNPAPVITPPLVPSSATAGSAGFTLTVNGTSFINGATVSFGGANRVTTFVSSTQVTAAILAADIATAGTPAVVVTNPAPGGGASNAVNFTVNNPVPVITPPLVPSSATAGSGAFTLTVNGTGFVNGSVVSFGGANRVTTFVSATQVTAAILAGDIATGGTPAVVVTNVAPGGGASNAVNFTIIDFSMANASGSKTVTAGQAAMYTINASGAGGNFPGTVTLSASGLPPATTASFNPQTLTPGAGTVSSTLTLTTTARGIAGHILPGAPGEAPRNIPKLPQPVLWLGMMGLLGATLLLLWRTRRLSPRVASAGFFALAVVCVAGFASGCNGGGFPAVQSGTPAGTYTVTVTGTSGSDAHATTVTLTVQ